MAAGCRKTPSELARTLMAGSDKVLGMGDDQTSVDVIVRHAEGYSLSLTSVTTSGGYLLLVGTLHDAEIHTRVETQVVVNLDPELVGGRHIERVSQLSVVAGDSVSLLEWTVETLDLGDGYRLHDAHVTGDAGEMRAFGIEDLAATIGAGIFGAVAAVVLWRAHKRDEWARANFDRKWQDCLDRGGSPTAVYELTDEVGLDGRGPRLTASTNIQVRCEMPR